MYSGRIRYLNQSIIVFNSGTVVKKFPPEATVSYARLWPHSRYKVDVKHKGEVLPFMVRLKSAETSGRIIAVGDSSCFEGQRVTCRQLLLNSIRFLTAGVVSQETTAASSLE